MPIATESFGSGRVAGGASSLDAVVEGAARTGRISPAGSASGGVVLLLVGTGRIVTTTPWYYEPVANGRKVPLMFGTIFKLRTGSDVYLGESGMSTNEDDVLLAMPAGTALELTMTASAQPGAGRYALTLRKEKADTAMVIELTGTTRKGSSSIEIPYADLDWLSMHLQSLDGAPDAVINVALKFQFAD